jgi:HK97 family phage portal protein
MSFWKDFWQKMLPYKEEALGQGGNPTAPFTVSGDSPPAEMAVIDAEDRAKAYNLCALVYLGVSIRCNLIASLPAKLYVRYNNGKKTEVTEGPIYDLLKMPSKDLTFSQTIYHFAAYNALHGLGALAVEKNSKGEPQIVPLDPRFLSPVPASDDQRYRGYVYKPNKTPIPYTRDQLILWKSFNPEDLYYGATATATVQNEINTYLNANKFTRDHFGAGGVGIGVLKHPKNADKAKLLEIKRDWNKRNLTSSKLITVSTEEGWELEFADKMLLDPEKMIGASRESVLNAFGLPLTLLNPEKGTAFQEAETFFWTTQVLPAVNTIEELINNALIGPLAKIGDRDRGRFVFEFDRSQVPALQNAQIQMTKQDIALMNLGAMTVNEWRAQRDMPLYSGDLGEFGDLPLPVYNIKHGGKNVASDNLNTPGVEGGRDQTPTGEDELIDQTGKR